MCELLGMSFNTKVNPRVSFKGFRRRGKANPNGWGLAFYADKSCQIFKEELEAGESALSTFLEDYNGIQSDIIIGHVRLASCGNISRQNTHPFSRELNGKEFVFAHNGTLGDCRNLDIERFTPIGDTDSEYAFCYLLDAISREGILPWAEEGFRWLAEELRRINDLGSFNCIFSDGEYLFCYYDKNGYNQLHRLRRKPPYERIKLKDDDWEIDLAKEKRDEQKGYIIATRPLTNEKWKAFKKGDLMVFKRGQIIYSYTGDYDDSPGDLSEAEIAVLRILRDSPHRLSLRDIISGLPFSDGEVKSSVRSLLDACYIKQDSRDSVDAMNDDATFIQTRRKGRRSIDC